MIAIISDVHSNLEALRAVLDDARAQGASTFYCLGDVVGYGPNPRECVDLVRQTCEVVLLGNHDHASLFDPEGFNGHAERAVHWTRGQLEQSPEPRHVREQRWAFLAELPRTHRAGDLLLVHGSARSPLTEYVFPEDVYDQRKMERIFALVERYCFQGHTHVPGLFIEVAPNDVQFHAPEAVGHTWQLDHRRLMVNVGSVGQPRDGDPRACYALLDGTSLRYRRVEYDFTETARKVHAIPELDRFLGDRLAQGR